MLTESIEKLKILIVESDRYELENYRAMLLHGNGTGPDVKISSSADLDGGIKALVKKRPDAVILRLCLSDSEGVDSYLDLQASLPSVPVVVVVDPGMEQLAKEAMRAGAQDYLVRGEVNGDQMVRSIRYVIERKSLRLEIERMEKENEESLAAVRGKLTRNYHATLNTLALTVRKRDPYTANHQHRVAELACAIGEELGLSPSRIVGLYMCSIVHDIGKMFVPSDILVKPGKLDQYESSIIKTHPKAGYDVLKGIDFPWPIADVTLQHHERVDGTGYPDGLSGEEMILEARILGVADVAEALSSHRPYRPAMTIKETLSFISKGRGTHFDDQIAKVCMKIIKKKGLKFDGGGYGDVWAEAGRDM